MLLCLQLWNGQGCFFYSLRKSSVFFPSKFMNSEMWTLEYIDCENSVVCVSDIFRLLFFQSYMEERTIICMLRWTVNFCTIVFNLIHAWVFLSSGFIDLLDSSACVRLFLIWFRLSLVILCRFVSKIAISK